MDMSSALAWYWNTAWKCECPTKHQGVSKEARLMRATSVFITYSQIGSRGLPCARDTSPCTTSSSGRELRKLRLSSLNSLRCHSRAFLASELNVSEPYSQSQHNHG